MTTMKMSYHAQVERIDRLVACLTHIGYNEFTYNIVDKREPTRYFTITDTGIVLVRAVDDDTLITGYMITLAKAIAVFDGNVPATLKKTIIRNQKKFAFLYNI